jgi:hypothetical protein
VKKGWTLHLAGPPKGGRTLKDLIALSKAITGRDPTPEEREEARQILAEVQSRGVENSQENEE